MFRGELCFVAGYSALILAVLLVHHTCSARNTSHCASSCGDIPIRYPFQLYTDPTGCGKPKYDDQYQLACEKNTTVLYLSSEKYSVKAINYDNFTIRVADPEVLKDNCYPLGSLNRDSFFGYYSEYTWTPSSLESMRYQSIAFVTCPTPVSSPLYVDASPCYNGTATSNGSTSSSSGSKAYSYIMVGDVYLRDLVVSCRIDHIFVTSLPEPKDRNNNIVYSYVADGMAYGAEFSWLWSCCDNITENLCNLDSVYKQYCDRGNRHTHDNLRATLRLLYSMFGRLLALIDWVPPIYNDSTSDYYILSILRYPFVLFVLCRGPLFLFGAPCIIILLIYRWRRRHLSMYDNVEEFLQRHGNLMPISYSSSDIKKMTKGFKEKLGQGGFGSVYKGKLRSGRLVAVKMLGKSNSNGQDFINEVATIGRIHHVNVVPLLGFCAQGSKRALIYDFMPNGSLDKYIFSREGSVPLDSKKLYEISLGVACGIEYLHRGCDMQILHFDIKPHNVLLDQNFVPKVSDFGLAKLYPTNYSIVSLTAARGTIGYMAPELFYKNLGGVSYKADVYSFGMLLMEMAGRRKNLNAFDDHTSQIYFPSWVHDQLSEGKEIEMGEITGEGCEVTKKMMIVALWCIQLSPGDRPSMHKVLEMLEGELESLTLPPKPSIAPQKEIPELVVVDDDCATTSTNTAERKHPPNDYDATESMSLIQSTS